MSRIVRYLVLSMLIPLLGSCTTNPVTGQRELSLISDAEARRMGAAQYREGQQTQGGLYYLDTSLNAYVAEIGHRLAAVSHVPDMPYEFVVLNNPVPNAWAMPGGKIAINRGLLTELQDEAQLAAVLGHEIVHAAAGHGASQMSRAALFNIGLQIAGAATAGSSYADLISAGSQLGAAAWMARYGRDDELEADRYGMVYMSEVGYDPQGAVELQRTFVRLSEGRNPGFLDGLFASHPPSQQRVDANARLAAELPPGELHAERYNRAIAQLRRDQPAYEAQQKAVQALNDRNPEAALRHLDEAIAIQPDESMFWELRGHAYVMMRDNSRAESAFDTAIQKNPDYYRHWAVRAEFRRNLGRTAAAEADLERARQLLRGS